MTEPKLMTIEELSAKIRRPKTTLRTILSRSEFDKFHSGNKIIINIALCYHLYNFLELRKKATTNLKSIERSQKLIDKLRKECN